METNDLVNHPSHYREYGLESLEAIQGSMSPLEYKGFLKGNSLKYLYRYRLKENPIQDLEKAKFYLTELIEETIIEEESKIKSEGEKEMEKTFEVGNIVHYVSQHGAEDGELIGTITKAYRAYRDDSKDGFQYGVEDENGRVEMAFSQELTLLSPSKTFVPEITHRSMYKSELLLEDAIERFDQYGVINGEAMVKTLKAIQEQVKAEYDYQFELTKRGRK